MENSTSSTVPFDEFEDSSPASEPAPNAMRKRKSSPMAAASLRKRPKAIHSTTQPVPATKRLSICSNFKGKGKRRQRSLDRDSGSPDFDLSAEIAAASSQKVGFTVPTARKGKRARKSTGNARPGQKHKRTNQGTPLFASASTPSNATVRNQTTVVHGQSVVISDDDLPAPRRAKQPAKPINPNDIIVIDSDSEPSPPPSTSSHRDSLLGRANTKTPNKASTNVPPGIKDNVIEIISSDEESSLPQIHPSAGRGAGSPLPADTLLSAAVEGAQHSESHPHHFDVSSPHLSFNPLPALDLPPLPLQATMDFDQPLSPMAAPEATRSGLQSSSPHARSPLHGHSFCATLEPATSAVVQSSDETNKSPFTVENLVADGSPMFGSPWTLSSTALIAIQPSFSSNHISPKVSPTDLRARASASVESTNLNTLVSPAHPSPIRTSPPDETAAQTVEHSPVPPVTPTLTSPVTASSPPIPHPLQPQMRIEPSVPPYPSANAIDLGTRHHGPGRLFGFSKIRALTKSASSGRTSADGTRALQNSRSIVPDPVLTSKQPVDNIASTKCKEEEGLPITSDPLRPAKGQSLQDVINRAYKNPPVHIDLTLDDSDEEPGETVRQSIENIPDRVRQNAKLLDKFLASYDREEPEDPVRLTLSNPSRQVSPPRIAVPAVRPDLSQTVALGRAAAPEAPSSKPRTNLDSIRSLIKRHQLQTRASDTNAQARTSKQTTLALPISPTVLVGTPSSAPSVPNSLSAIVCVQSGGPAVVDTDVVDVDMPSVSKGSRDQQMKDFRTDDDQRHTHPELQAIPDLDSSVPGPSAPRVDERVNEDDIRMPVSRKRSFRLTLSSDAADDAFDLMYPKKSDVAIPSPLKYEINRHSSPDPSPPPLSTRTSSRLSSRSTRSSSGDLMTAMEDNIDDDVDVYEIQSSVLSDLTPADSPYITWRSVRRAARERTPKFLKARDLPHTLQDYMNALPAMYRKTDEARLIFEAAIRESTADDEPDAPPIEIYNKIDDEVTPPWEFHYSNKMWYGEGVPGPDSKSLRGCDCEGRCDPQSKTCLCVKKQSEYLEQSGFVYNDKGRLIDPLHYPIFECNDFCGCGEECQNRVVQHGRKCAVNIVKTKEKGWGVFAGSKKIPAGTFVGIYSGELLLESVSHERGLKYDIFGRTYLFNIDGYHLQQDDPSWELTYVVDAYHAGNFTRFLNHSCEPNCMITFCYVNDGDMEKPLVVIFTQQDVAPWAELSFSYSGVSDEDIAIANRTDEGAVYAQCRCGAPGCRGVMFK